MSSPPLRDPSTQHTHHFYVATAKFVFAHRGNGIAWSSDPIRIADVARLGGRVLSEQEVAPAQ
jgi:hypothetical protein